MHMYPLAIAHAQIRHRRYLPKSHSFNTTLSYLYFDPDQLESLVQNSYFWSLKKLNFISLNDSDFLNMEYGSIRQKVARLLIKQENYHLQDTASIRVLALPRTLGFRFNSVVFYFVIDKAHQPIFILSEITNTPWNERKVYIHDCRHIAKQHGEYNSYDFKFKKSFHVSPFMPMSLDYVWKFSFSTQMTIIHMQLYDQDVLQFDATMRFELQAITLPSQQYRYAISKVIEPFKMVMGIYLNAFRLWKKKVPFYRHPKKDQGNTLL